MQGMAVGRIALEKSAHGCVVDSSISNRLRRSPRPTRFQLAKSLIALLFVYEYASKTLP